MEIELIDTHNIATVNKKVEYSMVSVRHNGYDYVIHIDPGHKDRLYLDVFKGKAAEDTSYNGQLPMKRSIFGHLSNMFSDYKTWLYNVTINRNAVKRLKKRIEKI